MIEWCAHLTKPLQPSVSSIFQSPSDSQIKNGEYNWKNRNSEFIAKIKIKMLTIGSFPKFLSQFVKNLERENFIF